MIVAEEFKIFKERMKEEIVRSRQKAKKWETVEGLSACNLAGWYDGFGDGIDHMLEMIELEFVE